MAEVEMENDAVLSDGERAELNRVFRTLIARLGSLERGRSLDVCITNLETAHLWFEKSQKRGLR